jgi:hypothetical protein
MGNTSSQLEQRLLDVPVPAPQDLEDPGYSPHAVDIRQINVQLEKKQSSLQEETGKKQIKRRERKKRIR